MEIDTKKYLSQFADKEVVYIPNPGNAGDALIAYATLQIMQELGIRYKIHSPHELFDSKIILYSGGGNLTRLYNTCCNFLNNNTLTNKIIVLPHTVNANQILLKNLGIDTHIICREKKSYQYTKSICNHPNNIYIADDLAFSASIPENFQRNNMGLTANCFRTDAERNTKKMPVNNIDYSQIFSFKNNMSNEQNIKMGAYLLLSALSIFETINTNRLHVAIAGLLLQRAINLYPNSYYKNQEVYNYSIDNKYKNVIWCNNL